MLMWVFAAIPLIFGYLLAARVLKERDVYLRAPVAYALGLTLFLFGVNLLFHFVSLTRSVYSTLALMAVMCVALLPVRTAGATTSPLGRLEATVVIVLMTTAAFRALFDQMKHVDDDVFPHVPLISLYLRDVFPPRNPFYPNMPYLGHYGRDLVISASSVLFHGDFFRVQYVVTALNQAAITLLLYFTSRRYARSPRSALLALVLAFLGGWGLMDVFHNNNSFVYLFLFLNIYLYWRALTRRDRGSKIVAALSLATYSVVYETHFGVLLIVFSLLPFVLMIRRCRWSGRYLGVAMFVVAVSVIIALVHGGILTDLGTRYLSAAQRPSDDVGTAALVKQQVSVHFPKPRLAITSFDGTDYPLLSLQLLREAGYFVLFVPVTLIVMFVGRRYWALTIAMMASVAILIPATVDFGTHNVESNRFLFFGGLSAAIVVGMTLGMSLDRLSAAGPIRWWPRVGLLCVLVICCWGSFARTATSFWDVLQRPGEYYWRAEDWACTGVYAAVCDSADANAAAALRPLVNNGESIMIYADQADVRSVTTDAMLAALSGAFIKGRGVRVSPTGSHKMAVDYMEAVGFRAIAFWNTADLGILRDIGTDYLLIDPLDVPRRVYETLKDHGGLTMVLRQADTRRGTVREVYRVSRAAPEPTRHTAPPDLEMFVSATPSAMERAQFYEIPFVVRTNAPAFDGNIRVAHRVSAGDLLINANDEIRHGVNLRRQGRGEWAGHMFFVAPFEAGSYNVAVSVMDGNRPIEKATFSITVR
jgi:hypothetical protein